MNILKYVYDYVFKKVEFSEDLINHIDRLNCIDWCSNLGNKDTKFDLPYTIKYCNQQEAIYYLSFDRDKENITILENLFLLNRNILSGYLSTHHNHIFNTEWNKVVDTADKYLNLSRLQKSENFFNENTRSNSKLYLNRFVRVIYHYFAENNINFPRQFYVDILKIYEKGHIIVGWQGNKALSNSGSLLIF
ncbi:MULTISPECIES: hypothetical protein [unclassified Acinetobacter]|uniref:hypothetical protein n=1 Tax=unclassified Acinetobacter TaxID=196816 RepID=UPI0035BA84DB